MTDIAPVRWQPSREQSKPAWPVPKMAEAMWRGACGHCPACGKTNLFRGYLKVMPQCSACAAPLGFARADDAPPYFTILVVGHIVVPLMLLVDQPWNLAMPGLATWAAVAGVALFSTVLGYLLYFHILAAAGATNLLLVTFLIPVSAILLGWLVLGETLLPRHLPGMALIGLGLACIDGRLFRRR